VLPFRDMSAAQDQAYFGEGIAEEVLNALVKIEDLKVASRTSAFSLADDGLDIPSIADKLDVSNILEGSIRTSGKQVRATAQLIDVDRDAHLWSESYDGTLDDIFKIQDEITAQITSALKVHLGETVLASSSEELTENPEAYQSYLQGRHLWRQRNSAALHQAVRLFNEAVELDPGFHQAWSNLAVAYVNLPDYDRSFDVKESFDLGLEAAQKALQIWPQSTEALIIAANYNEFHCDYSLAASLYEQAITYNPADPTAHHWYAILLGAVGRTTLAIEHIQEAHRIDPLISAVISIEAELNQSLGNYTRAEELHRFAASLGIYNGSLLPVAINHLFAGDIQQGKELIATEIDDANPGETMRLTLLVNALEDPGQEQAFEAHIGTASELNRYETWDIMNLLAILGSSYAFEFQKDLECPVVNSSIWAEPFREQRGTADFLSWMAKATITDYWREYGWPDDCASLDQSLVECP
jgi:TolB-like protein